jgi:membrane-bound lytic murein transglycosylase D
MKYLLLPVVVLLAGCQSLSQSDDTITDNSAMQVETAHPVEINQALLADESIDVIHPVADIDFSLNNTLKDQKAIDKNNIWPRIRSQLTFDIPDQKRLVSQRNWYVKHPSYL